MVQKRISSLRTSLAVAGVLSAAFFLGCESYAGGPAASEGVTVNLPSDGAIEEAFASITEDEIRAYTQVLASDEFGGRAPSSESSTMPVRTVTTRTP